MSDERNVNIYGVELSKKEAIALRTMFRSEEWNSTVNRILEKMSQGHINNTILNMKCEDNVEFYRAQGACGAIENIATLPDLIEDELR